MKTVGLKKAAPKAAPKVCLGAQISIAGGVSLAPARAREIGCQTMQIFTPNQTQWRSRPLQVEEVSRFRETRKGEGIGPVLSHASYLINLASPEEAKWEQSREAFLDEMERAESLGLDFLVFHPGAHMGAGATNLQNSKSATRLDTFYRFADMQIC